VKKAADASKCPDAAKNEIKLPKYAGWTNYDRYLSGTIERYCALANNREVASQVTSLGPTARNPASRRGCWVTFAVMLLALADEVIE
jgi:hypothetical protein